MNIGFLLLTVIYFRFSLDVEKAFVLIEVIVLGKYKLSRFWEEAKREGPSSVIPSGRATLVSVFELRELGFKEVIFWSLGILKFFNSI